MAKKTKNEENQSKRTRNYATIVYPESAKENWIEILNSMIVPALISPLHDRDVNANGEVKKAHYHVIFLFDSVKTLEQVGEVVKAIGGVGIEVVKSTRSYARYLCHLDNPDKAQYNTKDVVSLFGVDYFTLIESSADKYVALREIIEFCKRFDIIDYAELLEYCAYSNEAWFRTLCDNGTVVIKEYLKSRTWRQKPRTDVRITVNEGLQND